MLDMAFQLPAGARVRYGTLFMPKDDGSPMNDLDCEFAMFLSDELRAQAGTTKYEHCIKIINCIWPHIYIHAFMERLLRAFCANNFTGVTGCSGSGKSYAMAMWALISWWAAPTDTMVFVISTTKIAARGRIWKHVQELFQSKVHPMPGKMIRSVDKIALRDMPEGQEGNDGSVIALIAAGESDALDKLQGNHAPRVILLCDEGQDVDNAVEAALWNLKNNPVFEFRVAGNPSLTYDFHGRFCEPATPEGHAMDLEELKDWPILALGMYPGTCVHFNATDSPNYALAALGKPLLPYLPQPSDVARTRAVLGLSDPRLWRQSIGVWPKGGMTRNTVFADEETNKFKIKERVELVSPKRGMGIDPAYTNGGDQFMVTIFDVGRTASGESALQVEKQIGIVEAPYKHADGTEDIGAFARAYRVRDLARDYGIPPHDIGLDSTGANSFKAILDKVLGGDTLGVEFGASASADAEVSISDERIAKKAFANKATEVWFFLRSLAEHGQLKGVSTKIISQLVSRKYSTTGGRDRLEEKKDYKKRLGGASPDESDSLAVGGEVARQRMGFVAGLQVIEVRQERYRQDARKVAPAMRPMSMPGTGYIGRMR